MTENHVVSEDLERDLSTLKNNGIVGRKSTFSCEWAEGMREDIMTDFDNLPK